MDLKNSKAYNFLKDTDISYFKKRKKEVIAPAPAFKSYQGLKNIPLIKDFQKLQKLEKTKSFLEILLKRRSRRSYNKRGLALEEISYLIFATQGVTLKRGDILFRTAPSAGALYPVETYLVVNYSKDLKPGLYHLDLKSWSLCFLKEGLFNREIAELCLGQEFFSSASVVFIWSAVLRRTLSVYGSRGLRYIFMDVAHICENLLLAVESIGLKACPVGAFLDEELTQFLGLDPEEEPVIYLASVGT